jgi:ABC-type glycerol-3-phosphate transport system permease component
MRNAQAANMRANAQRRKIVETTFWYIVLLSVAVVTVFPFIWIFFTSFKGPHDAIYSVPPAANSSRSNFG